MSIIWASSGRTEAGGVHLRRYIMSLLSAAILLGSIGCDVSNHRQDSASAIKVAELKGQKAGIEKEIELQNNALSDLQQRIDAARPGALLPGGGRVLGPNPDWFRQQTTIRQRLITLQSQLAQINEELSVLSPNPSP